MYLNIQKGKQTQLGKIQKQIDRCNRKSGCDSKCSKSSQESCDLLRKHANRIAECRKKELPHVYW